MKYNRPQATASWGTMAKDWEKGIDYDRLHKQRLARAREAIRHAGLGAVLAFNFDNIRYITGTHIGEWARDKFMRYALCPVVGEPLLWDPAPPAKRISSPWIADNVAAPISTMQGGLPLQLNVQGDFAKQIKKVLMKLGIDKEPIGIDLMELPMLRALEKEGIEVVDGQQAMLDAREVKTADEIELLKMACSMVDATYVDICSRHPPRHPRERAGRHRQRPAVPHGLGAGRMRELGVGPARPAALAHFLRPHHPARRHGVSRHHAFVQRLPHLLLPHLHLRRAEQTSDRRLRNRVEMDFRFDRHDPPRRHAGPGGAGVAGRAGIRLPRRGGSISAAIRPRRRPLAVGAADHQKRYTGQNTPLKEGMVFALETWKGAEDGSGAARIEEEVVVTKDGCQIITNFPSDRLISCGLPGCEVF